MKIYNKIKKDESEFTGQSNKNRYKIDGKEVYSNKLPTIHIRMPNQKTSKEVRSVDNEKSNLLMPGLYLSKPNSIKTSSITITLVSLISAVILSVTILFLLRYIHKKKKCKIIPKLVPEVIPFLPKYLETPRVKTNDTESQIHLNRTSLFRSTDVSNKSDEKRESFFNVVSKYTSQNSLGFEYSVYDPYSIFMGNYSSYLHGESDDNIDVLPGDWIAQNGDIKNVYSLPLLPSEIKSRFQDFSSFDETEVSKISLSTISPCKANRKRGTDATNQLRGFKNPQLYKSLRSKSTDDANNMLLTFDKNSALEAKQKISCTPETLQNKPNFECEKFSESKYIELENRDNSSGNSSHTTKIQQKKLCTSPTVLEKKMPTSPKELWKNTSNTSKRFYSMKQPLGGTYEDIQKAEITIDLKRENYSHSSASNKSKESKSTLSFSDSDNSNEKRALPYTPEDQVNFEEYDSVTYLNNLKKCTENSSSTSERNSVLEIIPEVSNPNLKTTNEIMHLAKNTTDGFWSSASKDAYGAPKLFIYPYNSKMANRQFISEKNCKLTESEKDDTSKEVHHYMNLSSKSSCDSLTSSSDSDLNTPTLKRTKFIVSPRSPVPTSKTSTLDKIVSILKSSLIHSAEESDESVSTYSSPFSPQFYERLLSSVTESDDSVFKAHPLSSETYKNRKQRSTAESEEWTTAKSLDSLKVSEANSLWRCNFNSSYNVEDYSESENTSDSDSYERDHSVNTSSTKCCYSDECSKMLHTAFKTRNVAMSVKVNPADISETSSDSDYKTPPLSPRDWFGDFFTPKPNTSSLYTFKSPKRFEKIRRYTWT